MHEVSICMALVSQVSAIARDSNARSVRRIRLTVGPLSGVDPVALDAAFPHASRGSITEGAALEIETPGLRVACDACGCESDAEIGAMACGECGNREVRLVSGDELLLHSVALETGARESATGGCDV